MTRKDKKDADIRDDEYEDESEDNDLKKATFDALNLDGEDEDKDEEDEDDDLEKATFSVNEATGALKSVVRFVVPYFLPYRSKLLPLALGVLIETAYNAIFPLCIKYLIDDALYDASYHALVSILIVLSVAGISVSIVSIWYEYQNARLGSAVMKDIRFSLFDHLQTLSVQFYSRTKVGDILSRFSNDLTKVEEVVMNGIGKGLQPCLEILIAMALLFYLSWQLALLAILVWPLALIGPRFFARRTLTESYKNSQLQAATLSVVQENVAAQLIVKAFSLQLISLDWFKRRNVRLAESDARVRFLHAMVERSVYTAVLLLHLLILGFGAYLTFNRKISIGTLVSFENIFWELSYNVQNFIDFIPLLIQVSGRVQHINDLLAESPGIVDALNAATLSRLKHQIVFDKVCFSYTGKQQQLQDLSLSIPYGSNVAIVGPSGSGKSTVLNLLLRLYEPDSGSVKIDDYDLRDATQESLRSQIAVVFQENILFNISLRENILLGNPHATDEEVEAAARSAEIHDFIKSLPHGYDTIVGERGGLISGGQRQRIAIARAVIRNPAILILDEATSALDQSTEAAIMATLQQIAKKCTVISITHRLTSVIDVDCIFVLDSGNLIETGTHKELLKHNGLYSKIWQRTVSKKEESVRSGYS